MTTRMMKARRGLSVLLAAALGVAACDSDDGGGALANGDTSQVADTATGADASAGGDIASSDQADGLPLVECEPACGAGLVCARGACIADCGDAAATEALVAALGAGLTPVHNHCMLIDGIVTHAGLTEDTALVLRAGDEGGAGRLTLVRLLGLSGDAVTSEVITTFDVPGSFAAYEAFAGAYLAVAPGGGLAAFGYSTAGAGAPGEVLFVPIAPNSTASAFSAPGNYGADFLDDDTLVVNGLGAAGVEDGQGVYVVALSGAATAAKGAANMGTASGDVAVSGDLVLAGGYEGFGTTWPDGSEGNRVFQLDKGALEAAVTGGAVDVLAGAPVIDIPSDFSFSPDGRLVLRRMDPATFMLSGIDIASWTLDGGKVLAVDPPTPLTTSGVFPNAAELGTSKRWLLQHAAGYLVVVEAGADG